MHSWSSNISCIFHKWFQCPSAWIQCVEWPFALSCWSTHTPGRASHQLGFFAFCDLPDIQEQGPDSIPSALKHDKADYISENLWALDLWTSRAFLVGHIFSQLGHWLLGFECVWPRDDTTFSACGCHRCTHINCTWICHRWSWRNHNLERKQARNNIFKTFISQTDHSSYTRHGFQTYPEVFWLWERCLCALKAFRVLQCLVHISQVYPGVSMWDSSMCSKILVFTLDCLPQNMHSHWPSRLLCIFDLI